MLLTVHPALPAPPDDPTAPPRSPPDTRTRLSPGHIAGNETNEHYSSVKTDSAGQVNRSLTVTGVPAPQLLTTTQAATELGITSRTLARYVERGWLTPTVVLPSGHYRWDMDQIHAQLDERRRRARE